VIDAETMSFERGDPMRAALLLLMLSPLATAAGPAEQYTLEDGADCAKSKAPRAEGETHRCIFEPGKFGRRDFGSRNGRAEYVFSTLGPDCDAIEILADEAFEGSPDPAAPLRRVSVLCED
jgi:hypothetical protein